MSAEVLSKKIAALLEHHRLRSLSYQQAVAEFSSWELYWKAFTACCDAVFA